MTARMPGPNLSLDVLGARRWRVLLLTQDFDVWGAQRQIVALARTLDPSRYEVRLGTLDSRGELGRELELAGIPVESFERRWRWDLSPITRLRDYLRREKIDILHSFLFLPNFYARWAGRLAGTPAIISSLRGTGIEGWPRYALDVATCLLCHRMIANSEAGREHYVRRGGPRRRMVVVRNGLRPCPPVDPGEVAALRERWRERGFTSLIGMVGALEPRKDHETVLRALPRVLASWPGAGLLLAGDGSKRAALEQLAAQLGVAARVAFLGTVPEPAALYAAFDVYAQSSHCEGISNSILEAMAQGRPVVATRAGGNGEVIVDGQTGYLVAPRDPASLAARIVELLADPARRAAMGQAAQERVRTAFGLEAMAAATSRVYESVLLPPLGGHVR